MDKRERRRQVRKGDGEREREEGNWMGKGERRKQGKGCEGEDEGLGQMTSFEVLLMAVTKLSGRRKTRGGRGGREEEEARCSRANGRSDSHGNSHGCSRSFPEVQRDMELARLS